MEIKNSKVIALPGVRYYFHMDYRLNGFFITDIATDNSVSTFTRNKNIKRIADYLYQRGDIFGVMFNGIWNANHSKLHSTINGTPVYQYVPKTNK